MASLVDLCVKRELVNPNFDRYKLSLDSIPVYETTLNRSIDLAKPSESFFSSHHAKLFSLHNSLISDPWSQVSVYFCDREWNIGKVSMAKMGKPELWDSVFEVPDAANLRLKPVRFNVSVSFPSPDLAVLVNGVETLYLLETDDRRKDTKWKVLFSKVIPVAGQAGVVLDSVRWMEGENHRVECLVASVEEVEGEVKEKHRSPWITVLTWITLLSVDGKTWNIERTRRLEGSHPVDHASLDHKGTSAHIVSANIFRMVEDSIKPVDSADTQEHEGQETPKSLYTWNQTTADLCIQLTIPEGLTKANLSVDISSGKLEVAVKNGVDMIKGDLHARVEADSSTWTLDGRRLEIILQKVEEALWPTVVIGDTRGILVMTSEQIDAIHERLAHLTSSDWNPNPDGKEKPYNSQMLEECDMAEEGVIIMRIDGETHDISHKVIASNQFLFSMTVSPDIMPALCLQHDVDAFLWQASEAVTPGKCPWEHIGALNAMGYVIASKQQRRFCTCSPDMSVAVIAESHRHIYLYRQKVSVLTPLRNRKTGQRVTSVANLQVLTLEFSPNVIVGMRVTDSKIFVATEQKVLVYVIKSDV